MFAVVDIGNKPLISSRDSGLLPGLMFNILSAIGGLVGGAVPAKPVWWLINTTADDALAPSEARPSTAMVLTI